MTSISNSTFLRLALLLGPGLDLRVFRSRVASKAGNGSLKYRLLRFAAYDDVKAEREQVGLDEDVSRPGLGEHSKQELAKGLWTAIREGLLDQSFPVNLQFPDGSSRDLDIKLEEFIDPDRLNELDRNPIQLYYIIRKKAPGSNPSEVDLNTEEAISALQARFIDPQSGFLDRLVARLKANLQHASWFFGPAAMIEDKQKEEELLQRSKDLVASIMEEASQRLGRDLKSTIERAGPAGAEGAVHQLLEDVSGGKYAGRYLSEQWTVEGSLRGGKQLAAKMFAEAVHSSMDAAVIPQRVEDVDDYVGLVRDTFLQKFNEVSLATLKEDDAALSQGDLDPYRRLLSIVLEYLMKKEGTWDDYISDEGEGLKNVGQLYDLMGHIMAEVVRRARDRWDTMAREEGDVSSLDVGGEGDEGSSWGSMIEEDLESKVSRAARKFLGLFTSWVLRGEGLGEAPPFLSSDERDAVQKMVAEDLPEIQKAADACGLSPEKLEAARVVLRHMLVDLQRPAGDRVTWNDLANPDSAPPHKRDLVHSINPTGMPIPAQGAYSSNWRAFVQRLWLFLANFLQGLASEVSKYQEYLETGQASEKDVPHLVQDFLSEKSTPKRRLIDFLSEAKAGRELVRESEELFDIIEEGDGDISVFSTLRLLAALPSIGYALNARVNRDYPQERYAGMSPMRIQVDKYFLALL